MKQPRPKVKEAIRPMAERAVDVPAAVKYSPWRVGLDAFSGPMQGPGASKAEHRMSYTTWLYTPAKEYTLYLVDFDLDALAEKARAQPLGITQVSDRIAVPDDGHGLEDALQRHRADNLTTIMDLVPRGRTAVRLCRCKIMDKRLKGSDMRWVAEGAVTVATLCARYVSGGKRWDGFGSQPHRAAA